VQSTSAAGTPLVADEIMIGWESTGTVFACEQANISPDIEAGNLPASSVELNFGNSCVSKT
jgi:hypothetical protein